jgi:alpha,alpha-trehalase
MSIWRSSIGRAIVKSTATSKDLDRILEAEGDTSNRYKASKQADVLMLFYLFSSGELGELFDWLGYPFKAGMIPRNIHYYMTRTSHGSTLSRIVHSWVLARSDHERAWQLFQHALESDVADTGAPQQRVSISAPWPEPLTLCSAATPAWKLVMTSSG